jgi:hypothetical protein
MPATPEKVWRAMQAAREGDWKQYRGTDVGVFSDLREFDAKAQGNRVKEQTPNPIGYVVHHLGV